jgi:hypothetical protein
MRRALLFVSLALLSVAVFADNRPADAAIRALVDENMRATQASDLPAILETVHPEALARSGMTDMLETMKAYKLTYEAPTVEFISMAGEYALVRVVQRTRRVSGPDFLDNELNAIWALRLDGKKWKFWSQMILNVRPLAQPAKPTP